MPKLKPLIDLDVLAQAAECLRTLAHPHRLRMVQMLLRGRYAVGELAEACDIPPHMASEHLKLMQRCGFLKSEKEGRFVYYVLCRVAVRQNWLNNFLEQNVVISRYIDQ
jgi:DNA-binding transcriptional ArsR family regulator